MKNKIEDFDRLIKEVVEENDEPKLGEQFTVNMMSQVYEYKYKTRYKWLYVLFPIVLLTLAATIYFAVGQNWFFPMLQRFEELITMDRTMLFLGSAVVYLIYSRILIGILVLKRQFTY